MRKLVQGNEFAVKRAELVKSMRDSMGTIQGLMQVNSNKTNTMFVETATTKVYVVDKSEVHASMKTLPDGSKVINKLYYGTGGSVQYGLAEKGEKKSTLMIKDYDKALRGIVPQTFIPAGMIENTAEAKAKKVSKPRPKTVEEYDKMIAEKIAQQEEALKAKRDAWLAKQARV